MKAYVISELKDGKFCTKILKFIYEEDLQSRMFLKQKCAGSLLKVSATF